jgi:hypothetical protein
MYTSTHVEARQSATAPETLAISGNQEAGFVPGTAQQKMTPGTVARKLEHLTPVSRQKAVYRLARTSNRTAQRVVENLKERSATVERQATNAAPKYQAVDNSPRLINVNNPEPIGLDRVASEPNAKAKWKPQPALILKLNDLMPGKYRVGYEHENKTHMPLTYMFGIFGGSDKLVVTRSGQGQVDNNDTNLPNDGSNAPAGQRGGVPIAQMLNQVRSGNSAKIKPGSAKGFLSHVLFETAIPSGDGYFSGMVEFEVKGGPFTFVALAVEQGKSISPNAKYIGPKRSNKPDEVPSSQGNNRQNRVYNGISPTSELSATGKFEINSSHKPGAKLATWYTNDSEARQNQKKNPDGKKREAADTMIPIYFPLRDAPDSRTYDATENQRQNPYPAKPGQKVKHPEDSVGLNGNASAEDLFGGKRPLFATKPQEAVTIPVLGIPIIDAREATAISNNQKSNDYQRVDGSGKPGGQDLSLLSNGKKLASNLANFWHVYKLSGTITNKDKKPHTFSIDITGALKSNTHFAYKSADGTWKSKHRGGKGIPFSYFVVQVPAGQSRPIDAQYSLGAPSVGNLTHTARVDEVHTEA